MRKAVAPLAAGCCCSQAFLCHVQHTAGRQEVLKECQICLDNFKRGCKILQLPCEHRFCSTCIRRWLHNHRTCPVCRFEFPDQHTTMVK